MAAVTALMPRENLKRALPGELEVKTGRNGKPKLLVGYLALFDEWAEIDSLVEGHFMERCRAGSAAKTIGERADKIKCVFEHGLDRSMGRLVLGTRKRLAEDTRGVHYEVDLFDSVPPLLLEGLEAGEYGSSFVGKVLQADDVMRPSKSEWNPEGIPERSITEMWIRDFGPTPFPVYGNTTAGMRSLTDEHLLAPLIEDPEKFSELLSRSQVAFPHVPDTENRLYQRSAEYVGDTVWALHPGSLATILQIIGERRTGYKPTEDEIRERIGARSDQETPQAPGVAVIDISGPIVPRAGMFSQVSGATSVEQIQSQLRDAMADDQVGAVLLNIDSPGGSAEMIPELAAEIRAARDTKPVVAVANTSALSAAYHIASAASEIVATPSGQVGSIGVYTAHDDISGLQEKAGIKTTLISAGKYKVEGNPYEPLTDEAKADLQEKVDAFYGMFIADVAEGRGVKSAEVKENFGQGRVVLAADAVKAGMADRVATFDATLRQLEKRAAKTLAARSQPDPPATDDEPVGPEPPEATSRPTEPEPSEATTRPVLHGPRKEASSWRL